MCAQRYCRKENAWEAGWVRKRVALIKSLIYARKKRNAWGAFVKEQDEFVSWYNDEKFLQFEEYKVLIVNRFKLQRESERSKVPPKGPQSIPEYPKWSPKYCKIAHLISKPFFWGLKKHFSLIKEQVQSIKSFNSNLIKEDNLLNSKTLETLFNF